jgi:dihydroorotate dehydrogenase
VKIAPDVTDAALGDLLDVCLGAGVAGLIATNTTVTRPIQHPRCAEAGGLSGLPLRPLATRIIARAYARSAGALPIIGVGGVFTGADAYEKIRAGASAVQLYTGFIYGGPDTVRRILVELVHLLRRDGFRSVGEAVGADHVKTAAESRRREPAGR